MFVTPNQVMSLMAALLSNIKLKELDREQVQRAIRNPKEPAKNFVRFVNDGCAFRPRIPLWMKVDDNTIRVFRDAPMVLPFQGAEPENWSGDQPDSWLVQRRGDDLYVDGKKVLLHLVEEQKAWSIQGHELRKRLKNMQTLHPNVLEALRENQHLLPESWKVDEQGHTRFIFFWAAGFRSSDGDLDVCSLFWGDGQWHWGLDWLACQWGDQSPAAILAS